MSHPHLHHRPPRYVVVWILAIAVVLGIGAAFGALAALPADATPPKHPKVTICHNGHEITVADDGYWNGHIHHPGDTLGACPTPEPTEEPTWTPTPEPSSSASIEPTPVPEPSVSVSATPTPPTTPSVTPPNASPTPSLVSPSSSPVPSVTSTPSLVLPDLPRSQTSSVPYTAPTELAATGMSDSAIAGLGLVVAFVVAGVFLLVISHRRSDR